MRKNCKNFIDWVVSQYNEFCDIVDNALHLSYRIYSTTSSIVASIYNERTGKSGRASVKIDKFDDPTLIAIGLAWANYKDEKVPEFRKATFLSNVENMKEFQTKDGRSYTKIGYNGHNNKAVCYTHAMNPEYIEMPNSAVVYLPR